MLLFVGSIKCSAGSNGQKRAVVVGGGVGGMVTATRLARSGFSVSLYEKNETVGGRLSELKANTDAGEFRFDTGPSLLLLPEIYKRTFRELGMDIEEDLDLVRLDPNYRVFRGDESLDVRSDIVPMKEQLEKIEKGAFQAWKKYTSSASAFFKGGWGSFIEKDEWDIVKKADVGSWLEMVVKGGNPIENHYGALRRHFKSPTLIGAASFQDLYVGLSPFAAPAVFSLLGALEMEQGVWYAKGGMKTISNALADAARNSGVEIHTSSPVEHIQTANGKAEWIEFADGRKESADVFIVNADQPYANRELLKNRGEKAQQFSSGVVNLMFAVEDPCEGLAHHNIFLANDFKSSWDGIFEEGLHLPDDCNMYVHVPSKTDASAAPPGCSSVMCLVPCGLLPGDEKALVEKARRNALEKLAPFFPVEKIKFERAYDPKFWNTSYNLEKGAAFGLAHNVTQLAIFRPSQRSDSCSNLFYVGASTRPGNGVPLVMVSAKLCADKVIESMKAVTA